MAAMNANARTGRSHEPLREAIPLVGSLSYLTIGALWILVSDSFGAALFTSTDQLTSFQTYKGVAFICVSALAVHLVLRSACRLLDRLPVTERRLHDTEQQNRSLIELSPDGILIHEGGRILVSNSAFARTFGLDPAKPLAGELLGDVMGSCNRGGIHEHLQILSRNPGPSGPSELIMRRSDGGDVAVEHASFAVRLDDRVIVQSHFRDLTARNQARRELQLMNEDLDRRIGERTRELQSANKALETFTYSVAHDLCSPVARVHGFAAALQHAIANGNIEKAAHHASRIAANARLMADMIDGLLRLSRAERAELQNELVDCDAMVQDVIRELECPPNVTIDPGPLGRVLGDRAALRQVWTNLISNAVKYSSKAGRPHVRIGARHAGAESVFEISDNGIGFGADEADRLFGVFQRLTSAREYKGTGVGLAIVQRIVERHGGTISATGRPGEGATFVFALPQTPRQVPSRSSSAV
jgi:PAS domain S-box-containing protein